MFETHYSFGYTKHKGNIIVPERIGKHQNNRETPCLPSAESRKAKSTARKEASIVERVASVPPMRWWWSAVETRRLSVFLSRCCVCAQNSILCKAIDLLLLKP